MWYNIIKKYIIIDIFYYYLLLDISYINFFGIKSLYFESLKYLLMVKFVTLLGIFPIFNNLLKL